MSKKSTKYDCPICVEKCYDYTSITCPKCSFKACGECVKKFLLEDVNLSPKCMNCPALWTFEFIADNTNKTFHNKVYRDKRVLNILSREKSLLPATQPYANSVLEEKKMNEKVANIELEIRDLHQKIRNLKQQQSNIRQAFYNNYRELEKQEVTSFRFVGHCPEDNCKGFLDLEYTCGICKEKACRSCRQKKHTGEECNKDIVETIKLLAKDTKGCPSCGIPIFKIEGCNQMFCMKCHTAFDWVTGKIESGRIHNPHYFEWQRQNGQNTRDINDVRCGGLANWHSIHRALACHNLNNERKNIIKDFGDLYRMSGHIRDIMRRNYTDLRVDHENRELRTQFLLNSLTEEKWIVELKKREKKREKKEAISMVLQMFVNTIDDLLNNILLLKSEEEILDIIENQYPKLKTYVDSNLKKISSRFDNKVPEITDNFEFYDVGERRKKSESQ
jgi:hypothetical protein